MNLIAGTFHLLCVWVLHLFHTSNASQNRSRQEFVFGTSQPEVVTAWNDFAEHVPESDYVQEYIQRNPEAFHIPFKEILISGVNVDNTAQIAEFHS